MTIQITPDGYQCFGCLLVARALSTNKRNFYCWKLTGNAYSFLPPDFWIECTMNKDSKFKAE